MYPVTPTAFGQTAKGYLAFLRIEKSVYVRLSSWMVIGVKSVWQVILKAVRKSYVVCNCCKSGSYQGDLLSLDTMEK